MKNGNLKKSLIVHIFINKHCLTNDIKIMENKVIVSVFFFFVITISNALLTQNISSHPYERYGGDNIEMLTLSNGKYNEFFGSDSIEIIGSAILNTNTMKVIGFVERDTIYSEATLEPEIVSRWLSPDPLASKYPQASPYNFVLNSPIIFYDPDGREVYYTADGRFIGRSGDNNNIRLMTNNDAEKLTYNQMRALVKNANNSGDGPSNAKDLLFHYSSQALKDVDRTIASKFITQLYYDKVNPNGYKVTAVNNAPNSEKPEDNPLGQTNPLTRGISIYFEQDENQDINQLLNVLFHEDIHSREVGLSQKYTFVAEVLAYDGMFGNNRTWSPTSKSFKEKRRKTFIKELNSMQLNITEKINQGINNGEVKDLRKIRDKVIGNYEKKFKTKLNYNDGKYSDKSLSK